MFRLPARYGETRLCRIFRSAERFGVDPRVALVDWDHAMQSQACAYDLLRRHEEASERDEAVMAVCRVVAASMGCRV